MEKLVLGLLLLSTCATTIGAQGMSPSYVYLHEALVYAGSSGGSVVFSENIYGSTSCYDGCPSGVVHTPYIQLFVGSINGNCGQPICSGQAVSPPTTNQFYYKFNR